MRLPPPHLSAQCRPILLAEDGLNTLTPNSTLLLVRSSLDVYGTSESRRTRWNTTGIRAPFVIAALNDVPFPLAICAVTLEGQEPHQVGHHPLLVSQRHSDSSSPTDTIGIVIPPPLHANAHRRHLIAAVLACHQARRWISMANALMYRLSQPWILNARTRTDGK